MLNIVFKNFLWYFLKKLANLSIAIYILCIIILVIIIGSIIEQNQSMTYYRMYYPDSLLFNWKLIYFLGLDHVYQTWWFALILLLFMLSLITCTFSTQLPSLKNARRWKFTSNSNSIFNNNSFYLMNNTSFNNYSFINVVYSLVSANFFIFHQQKSIYSYKGLYGRISPILVHFSIVTILCGSIISFASSFMVQELIPSGELFHLKNVISSGIYSSLPIDIFGRVENFSIDYNFDSSIKQFFSTVSIFYRNRKIINSKQVSVNSPLYFDGVTVYQTDWNINALRIKLGTHQIVQKNLLKTTINNNSCWVCNFFINDQEQVFFLVFSLNNSIVICDFNGFVIGTVNVGQKFYINRIPFSIEQVIPSTGFQIKVDPGIIVIYSGFATLMLTTILSYLSYSQIWVSGSFSSLEITGSTNRAFLLFEQDILNVKNNYNFYTFVSLSKYYYNLHNILK
uniref:Cytochrome c biogenesis protein Ccs1 n=1 Tax=Osmundaria fimbriata TaxID=228265 RepID=A0A1Z1M3T8_OSMFI|nr:cytochrome c biogenesis protein ccs1 [Osmundaria fimbriata]ARW60748.1 cytochrome c biogenesis protein ccs1 [Osmundaria fimbriata]